MIHLYHNPHLCPRFKAAFQYCTCYSYTSFMYNMAPFVCEKLRLNVKISVATIVEKVLCNSSNPLDSDHKCTVLDC